MLTLYMLKQAELRKNWWPKRSSMLYLLASGCMAGFVWYSGEYGLWEKGPFLLDNWLVFIGLLAGSVLFYVLLLSVFREEKALSVITHLKSKRQHSKVN